MDNKLIKYFIHITTATPGMLSSLFIWKDWISEGVKIKEAEKYIDDAIIALSSLNELLIEEVSCAQEMEESSF